MNHSWSSTSNSPGFVYFNQTPTKNPADTTEFLSLGDSTPSPKVNHRFSPHNYSSPQFHSSPRKFNLRNTYRHSGGNQGNRSFNRNTSNNSFNSSYNSSYNNSRGNHQHRNVKFNGSKSFSADGNNVDRYYDHTCTLDPWADLQKELDRTRKEEDAKNQSTVENEEEEDSSSSEEESDQEECEESPVISNTAEEETT